jgi:hypothetical protein
MFPNLFNGEVIEGWIEEDILLDVMMLTTP